MKHTITCSVLTGLILCGFFGFSTVSFGGRETGWKVLKEMPTGRWGLVTGAVNGKIYAIGGQDETPDVHKMEVYNVKKGTWKDGKKIPTGRIWAAASVVKGKIYVIGGTKDNLRAFATVEVYNTAADTWTRKADMPTPRMGLATAVVGSSIYAIGGATDLFFPSGAVEVYNTGTDTWEKRPDMPNPRWGITAAAAGPRIYVFGGALDHLRKAATDMVEEYDTTTSTWTQKADLWIDMYGTSASLVNSGKIYVIGGQKWKGKGGKVIEDWAFYPTVSEYDPKADKWDKLKDDMPTPRSTVGLSVVDGKIYAIGGWPGGAGGGRKTAYEYQPPGWPFPDRWFAVSPQDKLTTKWGKIKR